MCKDFQQLRDVPRATEHKNLQLTMKTSKACVQHNCIKSISSPMTALLLSKVMMDTICG